MSTVSRSLRDVFRKKARTLGVILIVGLTLGVFLTLFIVDANVAANAQQLAEGIDTIVTVRPAGSFGFFSSETIDESVLPLVEESAYVVGVQKLILFREGGGQQPGGGPGGRGGPGQAALVEGLDPSQDLVIFGGGTIVLESGRSLNADDAEAPVALVGVSYGEREGVGLGDDVVVNGTSLTVVGLFSSGTVFGDNAILIPFETARSALGLAGPHLLYVEVDTVGNVDATVADLGDSLGADFDVVPLSTTQGAFLQSALDAIRASSQLGASISLGTGLAVMVFTMVLVTRERVREMGLLKALGFRNGKIVSQFLLESLMLAGLGFLVGLVVAVVGGPTLANLLARGVSPAGGLGGSFLAVEFALDPTVVVFALLVTALMGVVGSLYPILKALRMSPAEALRDE